MSHGHPLYRWAFICLFVLTWLNVAEYLVHNHAYSLVGALGSLIGGTLNLALFIEHGTSRDPVIVGRR